MLGTRYGTNPNVYYNGHVGTRRAVRSSGNYTLTHSNICCGAPHTLPTRALSTSTTGLHPSDDTDDLESIPDDIVVSHRNHSTSTSTSFPAGEESGEEESGEEEKKGMGNALLATREEVEGWRAGVRSAADKEVLAERKAMTQALAEGRQEPADLDETMVVLPESQCVMAPESYASIPPGQGGSLGHRRYVQISRALGRKPYPTQYERAYPISGYAGHIPATRAILHANATNMLRIEGQPEFGYSGTAPLDIHNPQ